MKLESGFTYGFLKADGNVVVFKFLGARFGDDTLFAEVNGVQQTLYEILKGGYLAYWEITE